MNEVVYGIRLDNGFLANIEFGQGSHVSIQSTNKPSYAYFDRDMKDIQWLLDDYKKFKQYGVDGLYMENGSLYQYHTKNDLIEIVEIKLFV